MALTTTGTEHLWTFIVDFEGGTYISQFSAETIVGAITQYNRTDPSGLDLVPISTEEEDQPVAVTGLEGVWATEILTNQDRYAGVHIIVTEMS